MVVYLQSKHIKVGLDEKKGGAICYLSTATSSENVINTWDCGRLIQQSYYGSPDNSKWNGNAWVWNPVQGGSWDDMASDTVELRKISDREAYVKTIPRNWGGCELCTDVVMETSLKLLNNGSLSVRCTMTYSGTKSHIVRHQEIPACFVKSRFSTLVYRDKKSKQVVSAVPHTLTPGLDNLRRAADARWVGYMDPNTKETIFIRSPRATLLTAYRVDIPTNPPESNCSYVAPLMVLAIKGPCTITYDYTISLNEIVPAA